jgi:hypothetical protein
MARSGMVPHIPLPEHEALTALLRVKPSPDMPRPGASHKNKSVWAEVNEEAHGVLKKQPRTKNRA